VTGADSQRLRASLTRTTLAAISLRRATGDDEPPDPVSEAQKRQLQLRQNGGAHEGRGDGTRRAI